MSAQKYALVGQTASFTGDDNKKVPGAVGVKVVLDITAVPGVDTVTLTIQGKDPASGKYYTILAGAAEAAAATRVYTVFPGAPASANVSANDEVPDTYRVIVTHSAGTAFNYTIGVQELQRS